MTTLIAYATTEGQTRKICRFAADHLVELGQSVELLSVEDAEGMDAHRFDAAILAGSVHAGKVQPALLAFARDHGAALSRMKTLYLQVSLSAAGHDPQEWAELARIADGVAAEIGWTPGRTAQIAGAFRFTQYDFFRTLAMRWIAHQKGEEVDPGGDKEYTDWDGLRALLDEWRSEAPPS
ncbi:flavodoxin domain-containing protein [Mesobacterium sp. TK19101]|uniref:Flavodoxin domain-containing protein n=1 Tax=Mesobacterium hydrothermale TaxID=3111907 RepID=A0ABU6HJ22_9RHOB|nr:flavodoxin domain-containing protein [Mesobacterium sp. TK19101]MEC3861906.1 flavodoxin domain-containing protein [Mesobacterium sp. TK19101]